MNIDAFIKTSIQEDVGDGDHTSLACIPEGTLGKAHLLVKDTGILAGIELAEKIFKAIDPSLKTNYLLKDGAPIKPGDVAFTVEGNVHSILMAERLVLNCMQRMSGIATHTNKIVKLLEGLPTKVLDTRKTTPLIRFMEKWAVKIGGGENHRFGLYDMILIKDNHVDYAGGIKNAIQAANIYHLKNEKDLKIEIEVRNFDELNEVLQVGKVDRIMLDNFSVTDLQKAVQIIGGKFETEASGGISIENIRSYAATGVNYISVGSLTHSIKSLDLSLKAID